jgi:hypothetical protein
MPVGVHKKKNKEPSPEAGKISFGLRESLNAVNNQTDAAGVGSPFRSSVVKEPPPSYDFERMIEEAMKSGGAPTAPADRSLSAQKARPGGESR